MRRVEGSHAARDPHLAKSVSGAARPAGAAPGALPPCLSPQPDARGATRLRGRSRPRRLRVVRRASGGDGRRPLGAALGGVVGPLLPVHWRGLDNLSPGAARALLQARNPPHARAACGAISAALPRSIRISIASQWTHPAGGSSSSDATHLDEARRSANGGIFFSGHIGNWEIAARGPELDRGSGDRRLPRGQQPDRRPLDPAVQEDDRATHRVPKGADATREMVRALGAGHHVALLVDQKLNTGIPVPFFGRDAMTGTGRGDTGAALRLSGVAGAGRTARRRHTSASPCFPSSPCPRRARGEERIRTRIMLAINGILEDWIRERPGSMALAAPALAGVARIPPPSSRPAAYPPGAGALQGGSRASAGAIMQRFGEGRCDADRVAGHRKELCDAGLSGQLQVLRGIDAEIADEEFVVLIGASGCGKVDIAERGRRPDRAELPARSCSTASP